MKKFFITIFISASVLISGMFFCAWNYIQENNQFSNANAIVSQEQGIYIFMLAKPQAKYKYLGTVKIKISWSGEPEELKNTLLKKVKKEFPQADGIIVNEIAMDKADAIIFEK